jgi:two-component system, OmpR family, sensor histidine kinase AdeS
MRPGLRVWLLVATALASVAALGTLLIYFTTLDLLAERQIKSALGEDIHAQIMAGAYIAEAEAQMMAIYDWYARPRFVVLGFLASFAIAGVIGWVFAQPLLRHVAALRRTAATVRQGNLQARVAGFRMTAAEIDQFSSDFNALIERVERAERESRDSAAALAHELRTPLAVIRGRLQGLLDGVFPTDQASIRLVLQQVELLNRLVEDLRFLTLFEAGRMVFRAESVDLTAQVRAVLADYPNVTAALAKVQVKGDAARLWQALAALLDNAARHAGGADRVELAAKGGQAVLRVMDRGPGLPDAAADRVFDRFFRAENAAPDGSGLGLSVVQAIVAGHGGQIRALPRAGGGTSFEIVLPQA